MESEVQEVQYTNAAVKRRAYLTQNYINNLESFIVKRKRIPGDRFIEITASDLDEASRHLETSRQGRVKQQSTIARIFVAVGLLIGTTGLFFTPLARLASDNPIQLAISSFGVALTLAGWILLGYLRGERNNDYNREDVKDLQESTRRLRNELEGRLATILGYLLGEMSLVPGRFEPADQDRLEDAIRNCWVGYHKLRGSGAAEYLALNNLVFYLSVQGNPKSKDFVLDKAPELKQAGEEHDVPMLLLTYCRALLSFSESKDDIEKARQIAAKIAASPQASPSERKEASTYLLMAQRVHAGPR